MLKIKFIRLAKQVVPAFFALFFLTANFCTAQNIQPKDVVSINAFTVKDSSLAKGNVAADVVLNIKDGWHINANKPLDDYLTPTSVALKDTSNFILQKAKYPVPLITKLSFSDTDLALYENQATIRLILKRKDTDKNLPGVLKLELQYQPCNNQTCLFPVSKSFELKIR